MVGTLIRERRLAKNLSQEQLADLLGTTQRQVTRWEGYQHELPRVKTRAEIGAVLGISADEWHSAAALAERPIIDIGSAEASASESEATALVRLGLEPVSDEDAPSFEEFAASAGSGWGNLIPQNYDEMRKRRKPSRPKVEPTKFRLRISGHCMRDTVKDGEIVWFDTTLPREPICVVLAVRDDHEAHVKRLVSRDGALWLEADDGWSAPIDEHWRILARAYTAQRSML